VAVIPLHAVLYAETSYDWDIPWTVRLLDGAEIKVLSSDMKAALNNAVCATLPAQAGTYLLQEYEEADGSASFGRVNVVGRLISPVGTIRPAIIKPEMSLLEWVVELPDKTVEGNYGNRWENAEAWFADRLRHEQATT